MNQFTVVDSWRKIAEHKPTMFKKKITDVLL